MTYKDGTPVCEGFVQFHPEADTSVTTTGAIQSDGEYRLTTMRNGLHADGALVGPNRHGKHPIQQGQSRQPQYDFHPIPS